MKYPILLIILLVLLYPKSETNAANSTEISDKGVNILCPNKIDSRTINRNEKGLWCDTVFPELCHRNQLKAAYRLCTPRYQARLKRYQKNIEVENVIDRSTAQVNEKSEVSVKLKSELRDLELEQKRIELKQRELDLRVEELQILKREQGLRN